MLGLGGELAKEVAFVFIFLLLFSVSLFCDVKWLAGSLSIKLLYYTTYFFKIWTRFATKLFVCFA